jgi:hypothetical protein
MLNEQTTNPCLVFSGHRWPCGWREGRKERAHMKRYLLLSAVAVAALAFAGAALAVSNAHFVGTPTATRTDDSITVSGKVAGLGNVDVITVTVTADAACVNPGANRPKAANKQSFSATSDVPVQNGKATFSQTLTATFSPSCSPPMTVVFSNVVVRVTAADGTNLVHRFPGTF